MIIPSIDLAGHVVVQLVGGREQVLSVGAPDPWLDRFALCGEVAVVDLDAAMGRGSQREQVAALLPRADCRVGGGIRDYEAAAWYLDRGAASLVVGTAARPELLRRLPRDRVIAALDAVDGEVVTHGWRTRTGASVVERMRELSPFVSGFLVTFVEREGRMAGTDLARAEALAAISGDRHLTIAGGVTTAAEVAALDRCGVDAQVGMAIYTGALDLGEALAAPLVSDRADGLFPTVVADERGTALGLAWSSRESLRLAIAERRGIYHSRRRGIWRKGEQSGAVQQLLRVALDCDRDALRFTVRQVGPGFCHRNTATCWGEATGLGALERRIASRVADAAPPSYTARLLREEGLLPAKLVEEARELAAAAGGTDATEEAADLLYFTLVALARRGVSLAQVERTLDLRQRRVTRRGGDARQETR